MRGVWLDVPVELPTLHCERCGEEAFAPELDEPIAAAIKRSLVELVRAIVADLKLRHSVTQQAVEDACRVTRSHFAHVMNGTVPPNAQFVAYLLMLRDVPGAFEYASRGHQ